jgi:hypothetical protein
MEVLGPIHWICFDKAHDFGLDDAETSVLERLYLRDKDIQSDLEISDKLLKSNIESLLNKLDASTRLGIIMRASILGIVGINAPPEDKMPPMEGAGVPRRLFPNDGESSIALSPPTSDGNE